MYAQFAGYIAANFFPGTEPNAALVKTFLAFGLGFLARPLGAVYIGSYGDRAGRKAALTLTILVMATGTGLIAASPVYATIGVVAPLLLLLGRLLQGFSAGGEIGGAAAFLFETAAPERRGFIASWLQASTAASNILGALVALAVTSALSSTQINSWGWRIPFILGLTIVPVGLWLRKALHETPAFEADAMRRRSNAASGPPAWRLVLAQHRDGLWVGFGIAALWAVPVYVLVIFLPTYVQRPDTFGFSASQAFGASLIGNLPLVFGCVGFGYLSDRLGRRTLLSISAGLLLTCVLPLFMWLRASPTSGSLIAFQAALCLLVASIGGVAPAALAEIFPTRVRSTGTALVYNGAFTLLGGFAPAILTALTRRPADSLFAPAWYVMLTAAAALIVIPFHARVAARAAQC